MKFQRTLKTWGVAEALRRYPGLSIVADGDPALRVAGRLGFTAAAPGLETISDAFEVEISVPAEFPHLLPRVKDLSGRIDRSYHRLEDDSFCLGSPLRLRLIVAQGPTLSAFIEKCVIPYLYGYVFFCRHGQPPFGEPAHGDPGLIDDFMQLLGLRSATACADMLSLIGLKRRVANKRACPCGSGQRLGRCHHGTANRLRKQLGRVWCRSQAAWLREEYGDEGEARDAVAKLRRAERLAKRKVKQAPRAEHQEARSDLTAVPETSDIQSTAA